MVRNYGEVVQWWNYGSTEKKIDLLFPLAYTEIFRKRRTRCLKSSGIYSAMQDSFKHTDFREMFMLFLRKRGQMQDYVML